MSMFPLCEYKSIVNEFVGPTNGPAGEVGQCLSRRTVVPPDRPIRPSIDGGRLVAFDSCFNRILRDPNQ